MTNNPHIKELSGVDGRIYYCVFVPSLYATDGICQGEWLTLAEAEADLLNWLN